MADIISESMRIFSDPLVFTAIILYTLFASFQDIKEMKISDDGNYLMICGSILYSFLFHNKTMGQTMIGLVVGFLLLLIPAMITNSSMGGDIKFVTALGGWLGFSGLFPALIIAVVSFAFYGISTKLSLRTKIPFGPFIGAGTIIVASLCKLFELDIVKFFVAVTAIISIFIYVRFIMLDRDRRLLRSIRCGLR